MQMNWSSLYGQSRPPVMDAIGKFVNNELWEKLNTFLQETYRIVPKLSYSRCFVLSIDNNFKDRLTKSFLRHIL
ncbi:hypothetical protein SDC9_65729 [bioreactor metagenome]|uniref:Uncharacterized protein n=1 Tax=bioreactor metagenome TaxID=1076179 RepID=A0A644XSW4_9ZZZZ